MKDTHTPLFPMEKKFDYNCNNLEEVLILNKLDNELDDIFNFELSLPEYYEQKNFKHRLDKHLVFTTI